MPSQFDLAFIDAVEYLVKHKRDHNKFKTAKELLIELGIVPATYVSIRAKARGVSKDRIPECIHLLTKKYGVSEEWLRFRRGHIMSVPLTKEAEKAMSYDSALIKIKQLEMELEHARELLDDSRKMIKMQQDILEDLRKK